jgi:predicted secreted protein
MDEKTGASRGQAGEGGECLDVEGKAGETIALPIASGPATGYEWRLELPEGVERAEDGPERQVEASVGLGSASGGYLQVRGPRGEHVVMARLARPWQPQMPVRVVKIRLRIV